MHKSVPKVPKVLTFGKVSQKIPKNPKILGGGSDLFWTKSKLKLHFFVENVPKGLISYGVSQKPKKVADMIGTRISAVVKSKCSL